MPDREARHPGFANPYWCCSPPRTSARMHQAEVRTLLRRLGRAADPPSRPGRESVAALDTVVAPDAPLKVFLTAEGAARAPRRQATEASWSTRAD
jgi:cytidylate kinase